MKPECLEVLTEHALTDALLERAFTHALEKRPQEAQLNLLMAREALSTETARRYLGPQAVEAGLENLDALPQLDIDGITMAWGIQRFRRIFWNHAIDRACQCEYGLRPQT